MSKEGGETKSSGGLGGPKMMSSSGLTLSKVSVALNVAQVLVVGWEERKRNLGDLEKREGFYRFQKKGEAWCGEREREDRVDAVTVAAIVVETSGEVRLAFGACPQNSREGPER